MSDIYDKGETADEKRQRRNRLRLADMLENRVTDKQFNMGCFTNACGTVGCALGIAVLSGEFGYGAAPAEAVRDATHDPWVTIWMPVKDKQVVSWPAAGRDIFGDRTYEVVINTTWWRSRRAVAAELREV